MRIRQISVFLENKPGTLLSLVSLLGKEGISLEALCLSEAQSYGLARMVVDKPGEAARVLADGNWAYSVNDVLCVSVKDEPGALASVLEKLSKAGISLEYSYAFFLREGGEARIILKTGDEEKAETLF